jgi:hypothetical protein
MAANRSIFRQQALEHYQHMQEPKTLPHFASPLTIFWYWVLSFILIGAVVSLWSLSVPVSERGSGAIRHLTASELKTYGLPVNGQSDQVIAILFFPDQPTAPLHTGSSVSVLIANALQSMRGEVERAEVVTLTADEARQHYKLGASAPSDLPQVSTVAFVRLDSTAVSGSNDGARVTASYQIGTVAILPLLLKTILEGGPQ